MAKVVFIAHPISGDVENNLHQVKSIVQHINKNEPNVVPFAPYYLDCITLDDSIPEERERGIKNTTELFRRGFIDEVRLYGKKISKGVMDEIILAYELRIPVKPMTPETEAELSKLIKLSNTIFNARGKDVREG